MKKLLLMLVTAAISTAGFAQVHNCGTDHVYQEMINQDPTILDREKQFNADAAQKATEIQRKTGQIRIIPVVFHIFHKAGTENISDAQVQRELDNLNKTYRAQYINNSRPRPEFQGVVADFEIEFRLARKDPDGNCTNGIVRVYDEETENGTNNIKIKSVWPTDRYLNVWVVDNIVNYSSNLPGIAGYAQFPWMGSYNTDGVIIINTQIGDIGTSNPSNASTVTHEVGHWLGLFHVFQDSCLGGDKVDDTPPAADIRNTILSCDFSRNTCSNDNPDLPDQIENFMDYTVGTCQNMFTIGQKARMDATMEKWRPYMWKIENLIATGTDVPNQVSNCAPIADFFTIDNQRSRNLSACAGGAGVDFRDNSYNYSGTITRQWIFEGGSPATSTSQNPKVTYATPGKYDVTLIVSNSVGSDTMYMNDYIEVGPAQATIKGAYVQDFEFPVFPTDGWYTNSTTYIDYDIYNVGVGTAIEGNSRALRAQNGNSISGARFDLFTPSVDISGLGSPVLSYYYAFAQRLVGGNLTNDEFRVYYSVDCGQTWVTLTAPRIGSVLNTVGSQTPISSFAFVPSDRSKWRQIVIPIPGSITATQRQNIRFRFQFVSKGGNNFYIDAINVGYPASVQDTYFESEENFSVYPNPAAGKANVAVNLINESQVKITVMDMLGREVAVVADGKYQGAQEFAFDTDSYTATGLYFVKMDIDGKSYTRKLVVE